MASAFRAGRLAVLLTALLVAPSAHAGEAHYVMIFGSQQIPSNPNHSHSFAAFVRASWQGDCMPPDGGALESFAISWLPQTLEIRTLALLAEQGINLPLHDTLRHVQGDCQRVSCWGPYRIDPRLYCWASNWRDRLEGGEVRYKAVDTPRNSARVSNCIHALSNVVEGPRLRVLSPGWGEVASYAVFRRYRPYLLDGEQRHAWVAYALGLDAYPIIYRDESLPLSGALVGPFYRLFGGERDLVATYGPPQ